MLSGKGKEFLDKKYPLVCPTMIVLLIPALFLIFLFVFICTQGQLGTVRDVEVIMVSIGVFFASFICFLFVLYHRFKVRKKCVAVTNALAIRVENVHPHSRPHKKICQFAKDMAVYDIVGMVLKVLAPYSKVSQKKNIPMLFVTVRELEEMYSHYTERATFSFLDFWAMGVKKDQWGEVVWSGFKSRARKSLLYEVAFMILGLSKAKYKQEERHNIIRDSNVEYILEAEK